MTTRKIEIVEPGGFLHERDRFNEGEIRILPAALAGEFIRLGWAKCCETGETGERKPGAQAIEVHDTVQLIGESAA
jgi:hypothetical protein